MGIIVDAPNIIVGLDAIRFIKYDDGLVESVCAAGSLDPDSKLKW